MRAPLSAIQWIVTGSLLAMTLVLPSFRWAVERLGSRRLYVACLLAFTATSALSAPAWSAPSLIAFRVLQGAVGGLLAPLTQALDRAARRTKAHGPRRSASFDAGAVAPVLGPVLGGLIIQRLSWRWLFLFNVPFGSRRVAGAAPLADRPDRLAHGLDFLGLALLSPGIALFT